MTYQPDIMLYHANCADGFGAAWAAWTRWGDAVEYEAINYRDTPPDLAGKHVLIGDFSFKREEMERITETAKSVIVLDHHKTAAQELQPWLIAVNKENSPLNLDILEGPGCEFPKLRSYIAHFDMDRSGARMVWDFCHPGKAAPLLIDLIQDRDLWRFDLPDTKPFGLWLRSEPFDFQRWTEIAYALAGSGEANIIMCEAAAMQRFHDRKVEEIAGRIRTLRIGEYFVPGANCPPEFASEVAHAILEKFKEAAFAVTYNDGPKGRGYSLRSDDIGEYRVDVSAIAAMYGGGGHRNAAGFTVPLP